MINPAEISPMCYRTPVNLVILLRRDDVSPYMKELSTQEAVGHRIFHVLAPSGEH
jgi:hypothetical protein